MSIPCPKWQLRVRTNHRCPPHELTATADNADGPVAKKFTSYETGPRRCGSAALFVEERSSFFLSLRYRINGTVMTL